MTRRGKTGNVEKLGFHLNSARNAVQPTFSGHKVCLSSGRSGSAKTAATTERSFWRMVIWRLNFAKIGKRRRFRAQKVKSALLMYLSVFGDAYLFLPHD